MDQTESAFGTLEYFDGEIVVLGLDGGSLDYRWDRAVMFGGMLRLSDLDPEKAEVMLSICGAAVWLSYGEALRVQREVLRGGLWYAVVTLPRLRLTLTFPQPRPVREADSTN